ncbi:MAG: MFS transporter [Candidatus Bathyarchaeia archaeon]
MRRGGDLNLSDTPKIVRDAFTCFPSLFKGLPVTVKALAAIILLGFTSNAISSPFWVVYTTNEIGLSSIEWGTILFVEMGLRTLLYIPAGVIVDRYGRTKSIIASLLLSLASIPLFIFSTTFINVLLVRSAVAVVNSLFIPACSALMADTVPKEKRGRVMAALGRGTVFLGATGGGTGGPRVGYMITIPIVLSSMAGGYLYTFDPRYPWLFVTASILISLLVSALYIRDPEEAEI